MSRRKSPASKPQIEMLDLRARLAELEQTLTAIRSGEVDALIVNGPNGDQVYSLKGAEQPYRAFIEQMGEGAVTLDPEGTILYCNKRFADMLQIPMERIISKNLLDYVVAADRPVVSTMLTQGESTSTNISLALKKARVLPVRIALRILQPSETDARCAVITDLTGEHERKALSDNFQKLQSSQADLQEQYRKVQEIRAQLEAANAAKDDFLAALSHELRTPLTPVLLSANALSVDLAIAPELRKELEMIRRNVELEARLIDDLLDLTRITRGKMQITPQPTNLHDTLKLAMDICESETATKRLHFVTRFRADADLVNAEPVRLQQIFWNLIRNAVKFTPTDGKITITTKNTGAREGVPGVVITVADSGIGIEPAALPRIFNAFEQGSADVNRHFGGLGIGLTISKRLVELHGGTIAASSGGRGKGSAFIVTLPTIDVPADRMKPPAPRVPARAQRPLRILLVEDHDDTRRNMTRLLAALKHEVVAAEDATTALGHAAKSPFDIVISDIGLPDESGLELMRKIRTRHKIPGICLSGYGMEEDVAKSLAAGFVEHLTKPINFQRLEHAIARATTKFAKPGDDSSKKSH